MVPRQVERLVRDVRDLGTAAQSDLGLDYAYLDDVTVKDWTVSFTFLILPFSSS